MTQAAAYGSRLKAGTTDKPERAVQQTFISTSRNSSHI
jgi:hypothetical protein